MTDQHEQSSDLHIGRGWLNRAAEMLDSCEDHLSDAEFARAAAAIGNGFVQLAAAEREAAAQAFVDERHDAERAEDLERIAANRTEDLERIAAADAKVWERQDSEAEVRESVVEAHRAMTARMRAEQALLVELDPSTLGAAAERIRRAADEARPHDDEPVNLCESDADMAARFAGQVGELTSRIEDALSWFDEPDDATPEIQLAKIRAALTGEARRG